MARRPEDEILHYLNSWWQMVFIYPEEFEYDLQRMAADTGFPVEKVIEVGKKTIVIKNDD